MRKLLLWTKIQDEIEDEKKIKAVEDEWKVLQADFPKTKAEAKCFDEEIWRRFEDCRKAQVLSEDVGTAQNLYEKTVLKKKNILVGYDTKLSKKRGELEKLMAPVFLSVQGLLDQEIERTKKAHIVHFPDFRHTQSGRELPKFKEDGITGKKTIELSSNSEGVSMLMDLIIKAKIKIRDVFSLSEIRIVIEELDSEIGKIDLSLKTVILPYSDYDFIFSSNPTVTEVTGFLLANKNRIIQPKKSSAMSDLLNP